MKRAKAIQIIQNALTGYVEDSAGANSDEAKAIQQAFDLIKEKPELTIRVHFSESDLQDLQNLEEFSWRFPTQEDPDQQVNIELFQGDEE